MKIDVGAGFTHRGQAGARVSLSFGSRNEWHGEYTFSSRGLTTAEITALRDRIAAHHTEKSKRMTGFQTLWGQAIKVAGADYRLTDCTIRGDEDARAVELTLRVAAPDGTVLYLDSMYPSVAALPSDAEILKIARDAAAARANEKKVAANHAASVEQLLKQ